MAELVLGPLISESLNVFLNKLASSEFFKWIVGNEPDQELLAKLDRKLRQARDALNLAEKKQYVDPYVHGLLIDLNDAIYKADDLLDEVSTKAVTQNKVSYPFSTISNDIVTMLEVIDARLEPILLKYHSDLKDNAMENSSNRSRVINTSLPDDTCRPYGRDKDKEDIIKLLLDDNSDGELVSVISIVGMGGLGKTTLAHMVYNDDKMKQMFDVRAWVCVSNEFDSERLTKTIIEGVTEKPCELHDLNSLQVKLRNQLNGKKFLVVLDDVWMENDNDDDVWDVFKRPFQSGVKGSKILLTTRNAKVSVVTHAIQTHHLGEMSDEDCWLVFADKVQFSSIPSQNVSYLEEIGRKIIRKCKGSPLAAQSLGGILKGKNDIRDWNNILDSDIWELSKNKEEKIIPALRISYHYLPPHLKRCFVYCSLYPKDHVFHKNNLILLWRAEDLLPTSNRGNGIECFNDLVFRSFFQRAPEYVLEDITRCNYFVMHDLMHDLAIFLGGEFYFNSIEHRKETKISDKTRHLSFGKFNDPILEKIGRVEFLRTLLPVRVCMEKVSPIVLSDVILKHKYLRVLSFTGFEGLDALPESIEKLIHLRYLDVSYTSISALPHSFCNLYNLQTLKLRKCDKLTMLPRDMEKLVNLYHLDILGTHLKEMPKGMSKLNKLQQLSLFTVGKHKGNEINELEGLSNLHGSLEISNLENVSSGSDASEAKMLAKKDIDQLTLRWTTQGNGLINPETTIDVLCKLQPHQCLQSLRIYGYKGARFPDWVGNSSYYRLMNLTLSDCENSKELPSLGQLPALKNVEISNFNALETIDTKFYKNDDPYPNTPFRSLESLKFSHMNCWKEWISFESDAFPKLKYLSLLRCHSLKGSLPNDLPALETLDIYECKELTSLPNDLPALKRFKISKCEQLASLPNDLPALEALDISKCEQLASLPNELPALKTFEIYKCKQLASLPNDLPALKTFEISECKQLASLPNVLPALKRVEIYECKQLASLPNDLPALEVLDISICEQLASLPNDLPALKTFEISECKQLASLPNDLPALKIFGISKCEQLASLPNVVPALETLRIKRCRAFASLPNDLPKLRLIEIMDCENLLSGVAWPSMDMLTHVDIRGPCDGIKSFPKEGLLPPSLTTLRLDGFTNLETLDGNGLHHLTSLQFLVIADCPKLEKIEGERLPASVTDFNIRYRNPLLLERYRIKDPQIWPKISHIRRIQPIHDES